MEIIESKTNDILVLTFKGRLDANHADAAQERVVALIDQGETRLVADLSQLEYISSAGLRVLMVAAKKLRSCNGKIVLCSLVDPIKEIFDIAGLNAIFSTYAGREEALKSFR